MRNLLCTIALIAGVVVISEQASAQAQPGCRDAMSARGHYQTLRDEAHSSA